MAKIGDINYLKNLPPGGIHHAVHKPISDPECGAYLQQIGTVISLLPPAPARILDLGCGTGWTSILFARAGYTVVGVDIVPDMIHHAEEQRDKAGLQNLRFEVCDYEDLHFDSEFDAAVFFSAPHHAEDEALAVQMACKALRPGGRCITFEPGAGHEGSAAAVDAKVYCTTEKDMPIGKIMALGQEAGFRSFEFRPEVWSALRFAGTAEPPPARGLLKRFYLWACRLLLRIDPESFAALLPLMRASAGRAKNLHALGGFVRMVR